MSLHDEVLNVVRPNRTVGLRFGNVDIPAGATIVEARVQFTSSQRSRGTAKLQIRGEASADAAPFDRTRLGISSRPRTSAVVEWQPPTWRKPGLSDIAQSTPDIAPILQEIVDGEGWLQGHALVVMIDGSGKRLAVSYDGTPDAAAVLHITYTVDGP